ncbi:MAG: 3-deoxy-manno-octulosonate cytidylyltransferase [Kiritimatiellales bacterium]|nr:3-deoxy-manno-octulosonate cytidylyltransferase [Kiritimatiellales bacterium]
MVKTVCVIPARWGSTRFPGKSLAMIAGKPMIQWVVERVMQAQMPEAVIVATDDGRIADCVKALDIPDVQVAMTRTDHPSGTDRIAEAVYSVHADVVINVQGDEPLIDPALIDELAAVMTAEEGWDMATAATPIEDETMIADPSVVKTVFTRHGKALYFSRSPIPHIREPGTEWQGVYWRHIGIYAYRRDYLLKLVQEKPCSLERLEKLEQLRALDTGGRIKVIKTQDFGIGVDTPADVAKAEKALRKLQEG